MLLSKLSLQKKINIGLVIKRTSNSQPGIKPECQKGSSLDLTVGRIFEPTGNKITIQTPQEIDNSATTRHSIGPGEMVVVEVREPEGPGVNLGDDVGLVSETLHQPADLVQLLTGHHELGHVDGAALSLVVEVLRPVVEPLGQVAVVRDQPSLLEPLLQLGDAVTSKAEEADGEDADNDLDRPVRGELGQFGEENVQPVGLGELVGTPRVSVPVAAEAAVPSLVDPALVDDHAGREEGEGVDEDGHDAHTAVQTEGPEGGNYRGGAEAEGHNVCDGGH